MNALILILQGIFAAYCIITAAYVGILRKEAQSSSVYTTGVVHTRITSLLFDLALLGLVTLFCWFFGHFLLSIAMAIIYRLFYGCMINYFQVGNIFVLDSTRLVDRFVQKALGRLAGLWQIIILLAALICFDIFVKA